MNDRVTLTLRAPLTQRMAAEGLTPDRIATLGEREIAALPIWFGSERLRLGDLFTIVGERAAVVRIGGDLSLLDGIGAGMTSGNLVVEGRVGRRVGAGMAGGTLTVLGDAGDAAGMSMAGGVLRIEGNVGDRLASAEPGASKGMTGGEVIVTGSAGVQAAARARRGLIVVRGDAGPDAARGMIAGTLVVFGRTGQNPGQGSKRGSIVAAGGVDVPATYQYACTYEPPHVRLVMQYLRQRHSLTIDDGVLNGRYRRFCGDAGEPGKGEILVLT